MIQIRMDRVVQSVDLEPNHSGAILQHLAERLDKEKFYGKLLLSFKHGILKDVKIEQHFSAQDLISTLVK